ncbi:MAG: 2-oxo acid dehydrogenase subunit E2 [Buchnera aphidicola (Brevicoryne brassicae)]|uniref:Dihydrolipoamide acetyltransferase component of pyruvate dehydrogenase complex n=1 Tax=Buchnera aphidicola (Brevicoryne brassicae) TaxID=911343 RepID=A0AAJ5PUB7_9GAMM|nr:2-oxo acid dehydrogenase subunit E2 [Buchnera aphidicola]WAI19150.1 MAG: 2-oxo acid dehydrogenase subunit E2 [Buchnera aphidicola (Brevicoryne brassicae)]
MDIEVKMPDIGLEEVEVIEILVKIDEKIELEQGLVTVEGEKASMEIPSPISGIVKNIHINIGDKVKTSSVLMILNSNHMNVNVENKDKDFLDIEKKISNKKISVKSDYFEKNVFVHATPVVRRLARNLNIELDNIIPTGPKNRILKEDVELYIKQFKSKKSNKNHILNSNYLNEIDIKEIELSKLQKVTGNNLEKNWKNIPHVTQFDECDITVLEKFRQTYNSENSENNSVTILVFILKAVAFALEKFPLFNSSLSNDKKIILKKYINIGVAVDVKDGLFVPVLKNVNKKSIQELSSELIFLSEKARKKKLNQSDMTKGSFTVSNLGGIGGSWFSPIINAPEVAILGISKSNVKPLWNGKEFIPSLMLPLSLSYDHRVINGADAARFIIFIGKLLSNMHFLIM